MMDSSQSFVNQQQSNHGNHFQNTIYNNMNQQYSVDRNQQHNNEQYNNIQNGQCNNEQYNNIQKNHHNNEQNNDQYNNSPPKLSSALQNTSPIAKSSRSPPSSRFPPSKPLIPSGNPTQIFTGNNDVNVPSASIQEIGVAKLANTSIPPMVPYSINNHTQPIYNNTSDNQLSHVNSGPINPFSPTNGQMNSPPSDTSREEKQDEDESYFSKLQNFFLAVDEKIENTFNYYTTSEEELKRQERRQKRKEKKKEFFNNI